MSCGPGVGAQIRRREPYPTVEGGGKRSLVARRPRHLARTEPQRLDFHLGPQPGKAGTPGPRTLSPGGTDGPSTTRFSTGTSFAFFTSGTRGSLGACRALRTNTKRDR